MFSPHLVFYRFIKQFTALVSICFVLLQVFKTDTRSAIIHLTLPEHETMEVDLQNCGFELLLSDKGKDAKYKTVYW